MRRSKRRLSISSCVSPAPRSGALPPPPPLAEPPRSSRPAPNVRNVVRRGSMYSARASSTCALASRVRARSEKICRTSCVRSKTWTADRQPAARSSAVTLFCCASESSSSKTTASTSRRFISRATSATLPRPTRKLPLAASRRWKVEPSTRSRAVSQSLASSARDCATVQSTAVAAPSAFCDAVFAPLPPRFRCSTILMLPRREVMSSPMR
mmetsp:Transcript_29657/g.99848  ORF Transcript_29657/g.99848 Transcript_29657/m.99848 type:complete len:211 (+) Transcript_29657:575-1207(+)